MPVYRPAIALDQTNNPNYPFTNWEFAFNMPVITDNNASSDLAIHENKFIPIKDNIKWMYIVELNTSNVGICHYGTSNGIDFYWYCPDWGYTDNIVIIAYDSVNGKKVAFSLNKNTLDVTKIAEGNIGFELNDNSIISAGLPLVAYIALGLMGSIIFTRVVDKIAENKHWEAVKKRYEVLEQCINNNRDNPYVCGSLLSDSGEDYKATDNTRDSMNSFLDDIKNMLKLGSAIIPLITILAKLSIFRSIIDMFRER